MATDEFVEFFNAHPLSLAADEYAFSVEHWFQRRGAALQARIERARASDKAYSEHLQPEDVKKAVEIIHYHQFSANTALAGMLRIEDMERLMSEQNNEHMKTILIGLDRSLLAWGKVQLFWPEQAEEMMHLASRAAELRLMLELTFPDARDFIRPGIDDASTTLM